MPSGKTLIADWPVLKDSLRAERMVHMPMPHTHHALCLPLPLDQAIEVHEVIL
jgi:hypothetical protein